LLNIHVRTLLTTEQFWCFRSLLITSKTAILTGGGRSIFSSSCSHIRSLLPFWSIGLISQFIEHFTDGRTPWTGDQLVTMSLPKHRATQTQNKHIHIPNIHTLCGIRTHDPGFRASEDSICHRPLGYRDRRGKKYTEHKLCAVAFCKIFVRNVFLPDEYTARSAQCVRRSSRRSSFKFSVILIQF
jgi:hypothetical protein